MQIKKIFLNIVCILLILYFALLAWQRVIVSTPFFDNDYKTFYDSLHEEKKSNLYQPQFYYHVDMISQEGQKKIIKTSQLISAVNMNTPTMNFLLEKLINLHFQLKEKIVIWTLLSLLCAAISLMLLYRQYFFPCLLLLWLSWPSLYNVKLGQVAYFILPFLCAGFWLYRSDRLCMASVVLGLLASLKLFF